MEILTNENSVFSIESLGCSPPLAHISRAFYWWQGKIRTVAALFNFSSDTTHELLQLCIWPLHLLGRKKTLKIHLWSLLMIIETFEEDTHHTKIFDFQSASIFVCLTRIWPKEKILGGNASFFCKLHVSFLVFLSDCSDTIDINFIVKQIGT